jgi:hypothetical protein
MKEIIELIKVIGGLFLLGTLSYIFLGKYCKKFWSFIGYCILCAMIGVLWGMLMAGCAYNIQQEKHCYIEYGQKGYIHVPTTKKNTWETIEIIAPKFEEVE